MPANLTMYEDPAREVEMVRLDLGEVVSPEVFDDLLYGQPVPVYGRNTGDTHIRELQAHLDGQGIENVQLAPDDEGLPGVWAAVGQPIYVTQDTVYKGDNFRFWARGVFGPDDAEAEHNFQIIFKGTSTGVKVVGSEN